MRVIAWSMIGSTPSPAIRMLIHSLILGTVPKQHIDWSRMISNSVTRPFSTLSGSMKPRMATGFSFSVLMPSGIWALSLANSTLLVTGSSGTSYANDASFSKVSP